MRRVGKYSKNSKVKSARFGFNRFWLWFKDLSWWKKSLVIFGPILAFLIIVPIATYAYFARDIANKDRLMNRNNTGVTLLDVNGKEFYSTGRSARDDMVKLDQISDYTKKALIASEDKNFYKHGGFSVAGILGALYGNLVSGGSNYGGSTLTQQLAKNTLLSNQRTYLRKYQELSISIAIERTYSKDEILEMYLNSVYYGENAFGIVDAAKTYFNKTPAELDLAESAMLIGVLPAPTSYSPISGSFDLAKQRQETVLKRMVNNGFINEQEKNQALAEQLPIQSKEQSKNNYPAPHFTEAVIDSLNKEYGEEKVARSGYEVKTTLDLNMQSTLQNAINKNMKNVRSQGGSNAAGITIDPKTGAVKALVGSYDWNDQAFGEVDMTNAKRQPGSSFKPVYYADALEKGVINPATILADQPTDFNGYKPLNALRNFNGDVTVRKALNWSLNIPAVKVMQKLGVSEAIDFAKNAGMTTFKDSSSYGLSLALGASEAKLKELANVYAGFANGGEQYPIKYVESIKSKFGDDIKIKPHKPKRIISENGAYLISDILSDNQARAGMFGSSLNIPGKKVAVKTGTTDENRDAWTIGYNADIVTGVWVGNNDNQQMESGGGIMAGPIWRSAMTEFTRSSSQSTFQKPSGVVERDVCYGTGKLSQGSGPNTYKEYFISGKLPGFGCQAQSSDNKTDDQKTEDKKDSDTNSTPKEQTQNNNGSDSSQAQTTPNNANSNQTNNQSSGSSTNTESTNPPETPAQPETETPTNNNNNTNSDSTGDNGSTNSGSAGGNEPPVGQNGPDGGGANNP